MFKNQQRKRPRPHTEGVYHIALAREAHTGAENLTKPCVVETRVFGELS
jgi:hypothetical protein